MELELLIGELGLRVIVGIDREESWNAEQNIAWRATHPNCFI